MLQRVLMIAICVAICGTKLDARSDDAIADALRTIKNVGPEGKGNQDAIIAWKKLSGCDVNALPQILSAFDDANPLAVNWLRNAIETVVGREMAGGKRLPVDALEKFLMETGHNPRARRFVFELLVKNDPAARGRFIPRMLNDPSVELRHDAVQDLIDRAKALQDRKEIAAAKPLYREAMTFARDPEQIELLVKRLQELGEKVDLPRHFGFLMSWKVIGPFENTGRKGFATVFPPEQEIDFAKSYPGKDGQTARWKDHTTTDDYGIVDLNRVVVHTKEVTAFAAAEFVNPAAGKRDVELRLGTGNAWKVWLNGRLLFAREEYHRGKRVDQYRLRAELQPGKNMIVIKVCQDQEKYAWTDDWQFQLRVCDAAGTAVLSADRAKRLEPAITRTGKNAGGTP